MWRTNIWENGERRKLGRIELILSTIINTMYKIDNEIEPTAYMAELTHAHVFQMGRNQK